MRARWSKLLAVVALVAAASTSSCSSGVPVTVNSRMLLRTGDTLMPEGAGCEWMKLPSSGGGASTSGGPVSGDISHSEGPDGEAFVVRVYSDQELLVTRSYSVAMLQSGQLDEFSVKTHSGAVYVFRYWGGSCTDLDASSPLTD